MEHRSVLRKLPAAAAVCPPLFVLFAVVMLDLQLASCAVTNGGLRRGKSPLVRWICMPVVVRIAYSDCNLR